jgi:hypothetical protein
MTVRGKTVSPKWSEYESGAATNPLLQSLTLLHASTISFTVLIRRSETGPSHGLYHMPLPDGEEKQIKTLRVIGRLQNP